MPNLQSYLYYGQTTSLCEECLALVPAKIALEGDQVFYLKRCPTHGTQKTLVSTDAAYFQRCKDFLKIGDLPRQTQTEVSRGCPYDCGLCPDHEQHSCLALIEITEQCNLACPICFADSAPGRGRHRTLAEVEKMLDTIVASESEPDLVQISGGEPTLHPQILEILRAAKARPIRHLMLNTNGVRIAADPAFVAELARLMPRFEVYLQFDSLRPAALEKLRGRDLTAVRRAALAALEAAGISTTLVVVVERGVNDAEVAEILQFALQYRCVRGVTYQPVQAAGRTAGFTKNDRVLLSEIRRRLVDESGIFGEDDLVPLPCHPEAIGIGYGVRSGAKVTPVTALVPVEELLKGAENTITFEQNAALKKRLFDVLSLTACGNQTAGKLAQFLCCLPHVQVPADFGYDKVFRVVLMSWLDKYNFCLGSVKRSCTHFVTPDGRIIPFDTYNLFHRPGAHQPI